MIAYVLDAQSRWIALVRESAALMLPRTAEAAAELWEALADPDPVGAVLGRLTRDGLADVPPFAMVAGTDRRRVIVRGGFRAVAADEQITASGVSTWVERVIPADAPFELIAPFAAADDATEAWPILAGMVPASIVRSGSTAPAPAPAVEAAQSAPAAPQPAPTPTPAAAPAPITAETTVVPEETMVPVVDDSVDDATIVVAKPVAKPVAGGSAPEAGSGSGDHDGLTIAVAALQQLRARGAASPETSGPGTDGDAAASVTPPSVSLRLPGGGAEQLTGEIVLGRSPSVSRASGTTLPRLVTIGTGDPDISRSHVRIGLEGGTVVVTDLHSRNGTSIVQPGRAPVKLRAGEPTPVLVGTVVDLGGGCEVAVVAE